MIVVFGSINIDMVMPVDHFPKPGETVLCSADYLSRAGGKGANQAVAAARAGGKVAMVGKVGDDSFGRRATNNLKTQSILTAGIGMSERPTGCSTIAVDRAGANMVMTAPGANMDIASDQVPDELFTPRNVVLTQLEARTADTFDVLRRAAARGTPTILNASPVHDLPREVLAHVSYLIVNEIEAQQLAVDLGVNETAADVLALKFAALGGTPDKPMTCIVTLESRGCVAAQNGALWTLSALAVEAVDTTGAGDAFCGIFAACLQAGRDWLAALQRASVGASLSCLGLGAQAGMPFMEDIEANLNRVPPPARRS